MFDFWDFVENDDFESIRDITGSKVASIASTGPTDIECSIVVIEMIQFDVAAFPLKERTETIKDGSLSVEQVKTDENPRPI